MVWVQFWTLQLNNQKENNKEQYKKLYFTFNKWMSQLLLDCSSKDQVGYKSTDTGKRTSAMLTSLLLDCRISIIGGL